MQPRTSLRLKAIETRPYLEYKPLCLHRDSSQLLQNFLSRCQLP